MDLPQIDLATRITFDRHWHLPFHDHHHANELVLVTDGGIETEMEGRTLVTRAGQVKCHPHGVAHRETAIGERTLRIILVTWREAPGFDVANIPRQLDDGGGRIRLLMEWMSDLWPQRTPATLRMVQALFEVVLGACEAHAVVDRGETRDAGPLQQVQEWARAHLMRKLYLGDLAQIAQMSPFHFARVFNANIGKPPMSWLRDQRVEAARVLLLSTSLPLRAIATQVGFADEFQLSRIFRRVTGQNPTQVRRLGGQ